ncbi:hypothetical protein SNE40_016581 [Patella caerulea]|uniref:Protein cramped-like n=2 Tax=Patella caerulea TaxID=87958 RepID=A0AAN8JBT2_PATCE
MPLAKRRKVLNEECAVKDASGNRVSVTAQNVAQEEVDKKCTVTDDAKTQNFPTLERRSRHTSRSDESAVTDDEKTCIPSTSVATTSVPLRSSTRVIRKTRKDFSPPESPVKKTAKETKVTTPLIKTKRGWELWSTEDKNIFFEALFEYGKDFDAIQTMLVQRGKKRGLTPELLKRKDQVRFLYYRTWHKIAKFINISKDVRKETQELYGLINYGIFRKTVKGLNEKTAVKLNELINKGYTTLRIKGKTKKLKTPVCSALKKINGLFGNENREVHQAHQVPEKITVELCPRSNKAWSQVQAISQNPRLRMNLMSDRTLGAVLEYLNKKWKSHRVRVLENMDQCEVNKEDLTIFPSRHCKLNQAITMLPQSVPRLDLTLSNYKENFLNSPSVNKGKSVISVAEESVKVVCDISSEPSVQIINQTTPPKQINKTPPGKSKDIPEEQVSIKSDTVPFLEDENAVFPDNLFSNCDSVPSTSSMDNNNKTSKGSSSESPVQSANTPQGKTNCDESQDSVQEKLQRLYEDSKRGWTAETGKNVTLAQLMLMCGKDKKLFLEYEWCPKTVSNELLTNNLANMLRRLAHLAATEFSDFSNTKSKSHSSKTTPCSMCGTVASRSKVQTANKGVNTRSKYIKTIEEEPAENMMNTVSHDGIPGNMISQDISVVNPCASQVMATQIPISQQNGVFRVPMAVPLRGCGGQQTRVSQAAVNQLIRPPEPKANFLIPRKRKKQRNKSIIIQRTLLPKTTKEQAFTIMSNLPSNQQQLLTNSGTSLPLNQGSVITQPFSPISLNSSLQTAQPSPPILPIITAMGENSSTISVPVTETVTIETGQLDLIQNKNREENLSINIPFNENMQQSVTCSDSSSGLSSMLSSPVKSVRHTSPPNLSTLLDMSLPGPPNGADNSTAEKLLDIALVNSNSGFATFLDTPVKGSKSDLLLKTSTYPDRSNISPPTSPNPTLLKLGFSASDVQWLNGEGQDISLSSFLTESPLKKNTGSSSNSNSFGPPQNIFSEHSQDSLVETSFQSMMNESSIDLVSKFAKLADHIAGPQDKT